MHKITKEHFAYFKKRCKHWQDVFGLKNWELFFSHTSMDQDEYSACTRRLDGYVATLFLAKQRDWPVTKDSLDYSALHEILHLLLARLSTNARTRFIQEADLLESEEEAVRTLCSVIREAYGKE